MTIAARRRLGQSEERRARGALVRPSRPRFRPAPGSVRSAPRLLRAAGSRHATAVRSTASHALALRPCHPRRSRRLRGSAAPRSTASGSPPRRASAQRGEPGAVAPAEAPSTRRCHSPRRAGRREGCYLDPVATDAGAPARVALESLDLDMDFLGDWDPGAARKYLRPRSPAPPHASAKGGTFRRESPQRRRPRQNQSLLARPRRYPAPFRNQSLRPLPRPPCPPAPRALPNRQRRRSPWRGRQRADPAPPSVPPKPNGQPPPPGASPRHAPPGARAPGLVA